MNLRRDRLLREVRGTVAGALDLIAVACGKLADRIDPPVPVLERARSPFLSEEAREVVRLDLQQRAERLASRLRHPAYADRPETILGVVDAHEQPLAEVVHLTRPEEPEGCRWHPNRCESPSALCLLDCPRPEESP